MFFLSELDYQKSLNNAVPLVILNPYYQVTGVWLKTDTVSLKSKNFTQTSSFIEFNLNVENVAIGKIVFYFEPGFLESINFDDIKDDFASVVDMVADALQAASTLAKANMLNDLLEKLNSSIGIERIVSDLLTTIKISTDLDAVGIRLLDGEDYPYYEVFGFDHNFVEAENYLCERDGEGKLIRDCNGLASVSCMCGNVIRGRVDSSYPFFTDGGSFWANSTTELLSRTTEEERQSSTRNRCNTAGYESVALIPLRVDNEIKGLLQLNHKARNAFSLPMIQFFERVAALIAIAIERMQLTQSLIIKKDQLKLKLNNLEETLT